MNNIIKCIIVEDEEPAYKELKFLLEQTGKVEVIDYAYDGVSALEKIENENPDVVFLDIQIPGMNGIDLANKLKEDGNDCFIVFVTAYDEHAVKAFEMNVTDYILKPYSEERIQVTVDRLEERMDVKSDIVEKINRMLSTFQGGISLKKEFSKIPCEQYGRVILIDVNDIIFCFIEDDQTFVKTINKKYLTNYTLHELESRGNFFRVHRSYLVNLNKIKELFPWFHGTYKIVMMDDEKTEIPVSRNNVKKLKDMLGL